MLCQEGIGKVWGLWRQGHHFFSAPWDIVSPELLKPVILFEGVLAASALQTLLQELSPILPLLYSNLAVAWGEELFLIHCFLSVQPLSTISLPTCLSHLQRPQLAGPWAPPGRGPLCAGSGLWFPWPYLEIPEPLSAPWCIEDNLRGFHCFRWKASSLAILTGSRHPGSLVKVFELTTLNRGHIHFFCDIIFMSTFVLQKPNEYDVIWDCF